jgi:hypothetical protein
LIAPKVTRKQEETCTKGNPEAREIQNGTYVSSQQKQLEKLRDSMLKLHAVENAHRSMQNPYDIFGRGHKNAHRGTQEPQ